MSRKFLFVVALAAFLFAAGAFAPSAPSAQVAPTGDTIVEVAIKVNADTGEFSTLIAALQAADPAVLATLSGNGQFTVFAPTDAAFAAIGLDAQTVQTLDQGALTNTLLYHVARGRHDAADVTSSSQIRMLNGQFTEITVNGSSAFIDNEQIVATDVPAANGTIHVINGLLLP